LKWVPLWIALLPASALLNGQASGVADSGPIVTDRPAVTASSLVVPQGCLQFENGVQVTDSAGRNTFDGPETLIRFGIASRTELRFTAPDYYYPVASAGANASGFGDTALGVKQQLSHTSGGFDLSAIVYVSFPSGAQAISSHGYDPALQAPWSQKLSANWTAAGMLSIYGATQGGSRNATGEFTLLVDRQLTAPWDAFLEYAGDFPQRGGPRHLLHFGTAYKLAPRHQLDFHLGVGLSSAAPDHFVAVGYSFVFQAFRRR